jgi:hypothetical protein
MHLVPLHRGPPAVGGHLRAGSEEAKRSLHAFCDGQVGFFDAYALPLFSVLEPLFGRTQLARWGSAR